MVHIALFALCLAHITGTHIGNDDACLEGDCDLHGVELLQVSQKMMQVGSVRQNTGRLGQPEFNITDLVRQQVEAHCAKPHPPGQPYCDMNGRICALCNMPDGDRVDPNHTYVERTDCGNQSVYEHPENVFKPLISFSQPAHDGVPATNAFCELNIQKMSADAEYNKDWLFQGLVIDYPREEIYDPYYCDYQGFLAPEFVALQHDFEGMDARAKEICASEEYMQSGWNSTMTLMDFSVVYGRGMARQPKGYPTPEEAVWIGSWTCAMGSLGGDIAYCAYSFCHLADGSFGYYDECPGWDPLKGMPIQPEYPPAHLEEVSAPESPKHQDGLSPVIEARMIEGRGATGSSRRSSVRRSSPTRLSPRSRRR